MTVPCSNVKATGSIPPLGGVVSHDEVRVKAYGLIEFTRSAYLKTQAVVFTVTFVLLVFALWWQPTGIWAANPLFVYLEWFVLLVLLGEAGETAVMLGKFRRREAARRRDSLDPPPAHL